jgi:ssDNA-binding Zn-finger/Zn-ribbon topoisomerase 1
MKVDWSKMTEEMYSCPDCGFQFPVWRTKGRRRSKEHVKSLYCPKCDDQKQFVRIEDR